MEHILDNPAYNALLTGNKQLANGTAGVKYFDKNVSPFVGFQENTVESFQQLYDQISPKITVGFISPLTITIPAQWKVLAKIECLQMINEGDLLSIDDQVNLVPLTNEHIPQMLALTKLTAPGPFAERTIDFGYYTGVFNGDNLIAMAGQRMNPLPYAEISAVCTHPDHLGRGYAKLLLGYHINRIKAAGQIPILHVRVDNERAIAVYKSLGFSSRTNIFFHIMQKVI